MLRLLKPKIPLPKSKDSGLGALGDQTGAEPSLADGETARKFLGIDVGSVSTNLALVDGEGRVLAGVYVPTSGRPVEAVREGYGILKSRCRGKLEISGIGTTGSGRYLAGRLLRADVIRNETTCQMESTVRVFPETDTIFEIGGQDSKYISVKDGKIRDFTGMTDSIHHQNLADIENSLDGDSFGPALERCAARLKSISVRRGRRPIVGIAGDLYTRQHPVANHDLYLKLEAMGCEVWPAPFMVDDVDFSLKQNFDESLAKMRLHEAAAAGLLILRKEVERWKVTKNFGEARPRRREPSSKEILEFVSPYLGRDSNQTLLLNIAKMVDFARGGADGVINAICFNCMLGTVAEALSAQIRRDYRNIPLPTLIYGTTELSSEKSKLEAFVYQVHQFSKKRTECREP